MRIPAPALLALLTILPAAALSQNRPIELEWLRNAGATLPGNATGDEAASVLAAAGDVNGDGYGDFLVGAWKADASLSDVGEAYLVYGGTSLRDGTFDLATADVVLHGDATQTSGLGGSRAGWSLAGAGDIDGDGFDDILVGAPRADPVGTDSGAAYLVYGGPALPASMDLGSLGSAGVTFQGEAGGANAGSAVAGVGDVNGDGFPDLAIGAPGASPGPSLAGRTCIVYGGTGLPSVFALADLQTTSGLGVLVNGVAQSDQSGDVLSPAGDVDGDGFDDVLIGARRADPAGKSNAGQAYVVFGGPALPDAIELGTLGSAGLIINGQFGGDSLAVALAGGGDVNADGFDDILLGADQADPPAGTNAGRAYLVWGGAALPAVLEAGSLGSAGVSFTGIAPQDSAGIAVALGGDTNRDGRADLLIGAHRADPNGDSSAGEVYLVHGGSALPQSFDLGALDADGVVFNGVDPNDSAGAAVAFAGDVDADGFDDLLVGARLADPSGGPNAGEAVLAYGTCHWLQAAGPVLEGAAFDLRVHGTPSVAYGLFAALAALPAPVETALGPWWLVNEIFLFQGTFGSNGAAEVALFIPATNPSLVGLTVHMQVISQPQWKGCDLTNLLTFTIE